MPTSWFHNTLPLFRSSPRAWSDLVASSPELTNTCVSQITGVAADGPGSSANHFTCSVFENVAGRFFSVVEPLKFGPRQCGQFSAWQEKRIRSKRPTAAEAFFIFFVYMPADSASGGY